MIPCHCIHHTKYKIHALDKTTVLSLVYENRPSITHQMKPPFILKHAMEVDPNLVEII